MTGLAPGTFLPNTIICCNTAKNGGGVYGKGFCIDCEIYGNTATENGGGINNGFATNCVIYANTAAYGGGSSSNECVSCTISNNLAGVEGGGGCGGLYHDCLIACNMATGSVDKTYGGGLSGAAVHRCVISNNVVEAFGTASNGGAFGAGAYSSQIFDSTVLFNMNYGGKRDVYGGGMHSGCASNSLFTGNACYAKVSSGKNIQGGGGYATYFTNCVIRNNYTKSNSGCGINGGGANSCLISNNVGTSSAGYTIRQVRELQNCEVVGVVNVRNCSAVNCRFVNFTNGYYLAKNENVVMDPNMRDHIAGPISYSGTTSAGQELIFSGFVATNCLIANNRTSGGLFQTSSSLKVFLHNCTIANNVCEYTTLDATNGVLAYAVNCIFVGNKTANGTPRNMYFANNKNYFALTNCLIGSGRREVAPGYEANTVTNDDARFVGGDGPDKYALKWSSPACGKGLMMDWMMDATDIRQDPACPRLRDGMVDIGCYQCWLDPVGLGVIIR